MDEVAENPSAVLKVICEDDNTINEAATNLAAKVDMMAEIVSDSDFDKSYADDAGNAKVQVSRIIPTESSGGAGSDIDKTVTAVDDSSAPAKIQMVRFAAAGDIDILNADDSVTDPTAVDTSYITDTDAGTTAKVEMVRFVSIGAENDTEATVDKAEIVTGDLGAVASADGKVDMVQIEDTHAARDEANVGAKLEGGLSDEEEEEEDEDEDDDDDEDVDPIDIGDNFVVTAADGIHDTDSDDSGLVSNTDVSFNKKERNMYRAAFSHYDFDRDGAIIRKEFYRMFRDVDDPDDSLDINKRLPQQIIDAEFRRKNKKLKFEEFLKLCAYLIQKGFKDFKEPSHPKSIPDYEEPEEEKTMHKRYVEAFSAFDTDNSGEINLEELKEAYKDHEDVQEEDWMFDCINYEEKGKMNFEEFLRLMDIFEEEEIEDPFPSIPTTKSTEKEEDPIKRGFEEPLPDVRVTALTQDTEESAVSARPESESPLSTSTTDVPLPHTTVDTPDVITAQPKASKNKSVYDPKLYFDEETIERNRKIFGLIDKDGSGAIVNKKAVKELRKVFKITGQDIKKKQVQKLIAAVQDEGSDNESIDFNEFLHVIQLYQENKILQQIDESEETESDDSEEEEDKEKRIEKKKKKKEGKVKWNCCGL